MWGKFFNFLENREEIYKLRGIRRGICNMHQWLRGMDAPAVVRTPL